MLTVVVPCYNERPNVAPLIAKLDAALHGVAWEVVYVDDRTAPPRRSGALPRPIHASAASAASAVAGCPRR